MDLAWHPSHYTLLLEGAGLGLEGGMQQLAKALYRRLITYPGELPAHPDYGCRLRDYAGLPADAWVARLAALEAKRALEADPRVERAEVEAYHDADGLQVVAKVKPVAGWDEIVVEVRVP
ncbi:GPW/gp25 family protein [Thermus sp. 93170]|uniref:GPW/gp25 family protein n=1 Tax=Thermus sp. 93170 TaxID=1046939 RepID=UPI003F41E85D